MMSQNDELPDKWAGYEDPKRLLTRSEIALVERVAKEVWTEAGGDREQAERLLFWRAITESFVYARMSPLAEQVWDGLPKKPREKTDGKPTDRTGER